MIAANARKEIVRFFVAGTFVIATDFSIYYFLVNFFPFSLAKGISCACASIAGYLLNKHWTFKYHQPSYAEVGRYILINFLALGINVVTNQSILNVWPGAIELALVIATVVTSLFSFICFKWWVFRTLLKEAVILSGKDSSRSKHE